MPFSTLVDAGGTIYVSGQIPIDANGTLLQGDIETQTSQVLSSIERVLREVGSSKEEIVKTTVYLTDVRRDFAAMNRAYAAFFGEHRPARTTLGVELAVDVVVEIDAVAVRGHSSNPPARPD